MLGKFRIFDSIRNAARSTASRNIAANFTGVIWLNALSVLVIPIYIGRLGAAEWGLIATCLSVQIFFSIIDTGLSQVLPRWIAINHDDRGSQFGVYSTFLRFYLIAGVALFISGQLFAHKFAHDLVKASPDDADRLETCFRIIVLQLSCQLANNVNIGFWNGRQDQGLANFRNIIFGTLKHVLALSAVIIGGLGVFGYVIAFSLVAAIELLANSATIFLKFGKSSVVAHGKFSIREVIKDTGLMTMAAIVGAVVAQFDRLTLLHVVSPAQFGVYAVILNVSATFLQIQAPITRALFPKIVSEVRLGGFVWLKRLALGTILSCVIPCLGAACLTKEILGLWIHNPFFVQVGAPPLSMLLVAISINSLYNVTYSYFLAAGQARIIFGINIACLVAVGSFALMAPRTLGLFMGSGMVLLNSTIQVLLGSALLYRTIYKGRELRGN